MTQTSETQHLPPFRPFLWTGVLLSLFGWGGLAILFAVTLPTLGPRWMFFFLFLIGLSGTSLPLMYYLNLRFPTMPPAEAGDMLREALFVGLYGCIVAWLLLGRVLTAPLAVILASGFFLVEFLIRVRQISQWKPKGPVDE
ncbi:MAG: hypothetical protein HY835_04770 [Anaerolineae bacterium]|nr:hypothetical protein [Anaerolineae bacterium]